MADSCGDIYLDFLSTKKVLAFQTSWLLKGGGSGRGIFCCFFLFCEGWGEGGGAGYVGTISVTVATVSTESSNLLQGLLKKYLRNISVKDICTSEVKKPILIFLDESLW